MAHIFNENTSKTFSLPKNSSLINYSVLKEFYSPSPFRSFSIKYVVEGSELYAVNGTKYLIGKRQYLLANKHNEGYVMVDSKNPVTGICIDIAPDILSEVVSSYLNPNTSFTDLALDTFFNSSSFLENKYDAPQTHLGSLLLQLETSFLENPQQSLNLNNDFYYTLSEKIIADHIPVFKQLQSIKAIKQETKKILLRKLNYAREFIHEFFLDDVSVGKIAREIGMSEYHFFRLFKSVFKLSPHQYIIQQRLRFSREMIEKNQLPVTTAASLSGFSDIHAFSKSFKKHYGFPPSRLLQHQPIV